MSDPSVTDAEKDKAIKTLSNTITTMYEGDLRELNYKIKEFTDRQDNLHKQIDREKEYFSNEDHFKEAQEMMATIQIYKEKLIAIKRDMNNIHARTKNVKKKANDIQDFKIRQINAPK